MLSRQIETVSAVQAVVADLRDRLLDNDFSPGTQVTEADVAGEYGVSRPTARSAITELINDSLLRQSANRPAYVPRLLPADVEDLFFVRIPLELAVVRFVIAHGIVPDGCRIAVEDVRRIADDAPTSQFVRADLRFHQLLVDSVQSVRLTELYKSIRGEIHLSMVQSHRVLGSVRIAKEHGDILAALQARNEQDAVGLMQSHLENACTDIATWLEEAARV